MSDLMELGRCAVVCGGWRWMRGMVTTTGESVLGEGGGYPILAHRRCAGLPPVPDLSDPATMGCLLALVREAWGEPLVQVEPCLAEATLQWVVWVSDDVRFYGPTEAGALVAALEAAP